MDGGSSATICAPQCEEYRYAKRPSRCCHNLYFYLSQHLHNITSITHHFIITLLTDHR
jgi:hypothetical protein